MAELEAEQSAISAKLQDPDFIRKNPNEIKSLEARLSEIQKEDEVLFERWSFLEERKAALEE